MLLCTGVWLLPCWRSMSNNSTASPLSSFLTAPQYLYLNQSVSDSVTGSERCSKQSTAQMLPAAGSLGYHYQAELPDGTLLCSRQPETLPSVGTHTCSDQDTSSPGRLCAPWQRHHSWWQHKQGAEGLERGKMKGKMVAGVTDIILVIHVVGKDEFMHIL